jgi:Heparinase II/III-like protein
MTVGRFFKLVAPHVKRTLDEVKARYANRNGGDEASRARDYLDEQRLDYRHVPYCVDALFGDAQGGLDAALVVALAQSVRLGSPGRRACAAEDLAVGDASSWEALRRRLASDAAKTSRSFEIPLAGLDPLTGLKRYAYPDFGLYIFRSRQLYVAVRCGRFDVAKTNGAHAHNDQLAIEVHADGRDLIADPGSYLYTPLPDRRNAFRSVQAHCAPRIEAREPASLGIGLFKLEDRARAQCLYFGARGFAGVHWGYGEPVHRIVEIAAQRVKVTDYASGGLVLVAPPPGDFQLPARAYSPGYGLLLAARRREGSLAKEGGEAGLSVSSARCDVF